MARRFKRRFLSVTATVTSAVFLFTNIAFAHQPQTVLWKERRTPLQVASLPRTMNAPFNGNLTAIQNELLNQVPQIKSAFSPQSSRHLSIDKKRSMAYRSGLPEKIFSHINIKKVVPGRKNQTVLLLEDVHQNLEAQEHISSALTSFVSPELNKHSIVVGVEGANGPFLYDVFKEFSRPEILSRAADSYLASGDISGPAHAGFSSTSLAGSKRVLFWGVDDAAAYRANVQAYKESSSLKSALEKKIGAIEKDLARQKETVLSTELKNFDNTVNAYRQGTISLTQYARTLAKFNEPVSLSFELFLNAAEMERSLDFSQVESERRRVIEKLVRVLGENELHTLIDLSLSYQQGTLTFADYYQNLKHICSKAGIQLSQTPHFDNYIRYVLLADGVDAETLLSDVESLENRIYDRLSINKEQKELVAKSRQIYLAKELTHFALTSHQWETYRQGRPLYRNELDLDSFERFYASADKRSKAMVGNLLTKMNNDSLGVMVVGGFHSEEMIPLLKDQNVSVIVASPKLTKVDAGSGSAYLSVFDREKTPLEQIFAGRPLFVAPPATGALTPLLPGAPDATKPIAFDAAVLAAAESGQSNPGDIRMLQQIGIPVQNMTVQISDGKPVVQTETGNSTLESVISEGNAPARKGPIARILNKVISTRVVGTKSIVTSAARSLTGMIGFRFSSSTRKATLLASIALVFLLASPAFAGSGSASSVHPFGFGAFIIFGGIFLLAAVMQVVPSRRPLVGGVWKAGKTPLEEIVGVGGAETFIRDLNRIGMPEGRDVIIFMPESQYPKAVAANKDVSTKVGIGALKAGEKTRAGYKALVEQGVTHIAIDVKDVNGTPIDRQIAMALAAKLKPVLFVGETLAQFPEKTRGVMEMQMEYALKGLQPNQIKQLIIAYAPFRAEPTDKPLKPEYIQRVHSEIRKWIESKYNSTVSKEVRVVYAARHVGPNNVDLIASQPDVDGVIVYNGATRLADAFSRVIRFRASATAIALLVSFFVLGAAAPQAVASNSATAAIAHSVTAASAGHPVSIVFVGLVLFALVAILSFSPNRTPLIVSNRKDKKPLRSDIDAFFKELRSLGLSAPGREVVVAPGFAALDTVREAGKEFDIELGAQDVFLDPADFPQIKAMTGEVTAPALAEAGVKYVIIGHSERRTLLKESNKMANLKIKAALRAGLIPIYCIGETGKERKADQTNFVLMRQIQEGLEGLSTEDIEKLVIAYEPVWAIGTGETATPEQAQEAHAFIRRTIADLESDPDAEKVRILYGGSVNEKNVDSLMAKPDVDGALVGGASLVAASFKQIVETGLPASQPKSVTQPAPQEGPTEKTAPKKRATPLTAEPLEEFLADWALGVDYDTLPAEVINVAKNHILNAGANSVRALNYNLGRSTRDMALKEKSTNGKGATVFGTALKTTARLATLYFGALVRDLDWDLTYLGQEPSHPDDNLAVLLAVAENEGYSGKDVILSLVIGEEIQVRLADALKLRDKGIDHVTYLVISATLALARLKKLTREQTIEALRIAIPDSHFSRSMRQKGLNSLKSWHAAIAQERALLAVEAAQRGINGPKDVFNTKFGFTHEILRGQDLRDYVRDFPTADNQLPYAIVNEVFPKGFQAEYHAQSGIEVAFDLHKQLRAMFNDQSPRDAGLSAETLAHIQSATLRTFETFLTIIADKDRKNFIKNRETADHDGAYIIMHALVFGYHDERAYSQEHLKDPRVQALRASLNLEEDEVATERYYRSDPKEKWNSNEVILELDNSQTIREHRTNAFGHSANPWPIDADNVDAGKVTQLAQEYADGQMGWHRKVAFQLINVYGAEGAAALINRAMAFDQIPSEGMEDFMRAWTIAGNGWTDLTVEEDHTGSTPPAWTSVRPVVSALVLIATLLVFGSATPQAVASNGTAAFASSSIGGLALIGFVLLFAVLGSGLKAVPESAGTSTPSNSTMEWTIRVPLSSILANHHAPEGLTKEGEEYLSVLKRRREISEFLLDVDGKDLVIMLEVARATVEAAPEFVRDSAVDTLRQIVRSGNGNGWIKKGVAETLRRSNSQAIDTLKISITNGENQQAGSNNDGRGPSGSSGTTGAALALIVGLISLGFTAQPAQAASTVISTLAWTASSSFSSPHLFFGVIALAVFYVILSGMRMAGDQGWGRLISHRIPQRVRLDTTNVLADINADHGFEAAEVRRVDNVLKSIHQRVEADVPYDQLVKEQRAWRASGDLSVPEVKKFITDSKAAAHLVQHLHEVGEVEDVVIIGIGGSDLGARALHEALAGGEYYNQRRNRKTPRIHFIGDKFEHTDITNLDNIVDWSKTVVIPISKSGKTSEAFWAYTQVKKRLKAALGEDDYGDRVLAVTGFDSSSELFKENEALVAKSTSEKRRGFMALLPVPDGVGGRYSVFSPVGLIYAGIAGLDIDKLLHGYNEAASISKSLSPADPNNIAYRLAAFTYLAQLRLPKKTKLHFTPFAKLKALAEWYRQGFNESLGKNQNVAITVTSAVGSTDLHSSAQARLDGANDFIEILTQIEEQPTDTETLEGAPAGELSALEGLTATQLQHSVREGFAKALTDSGRLNMTIHVQRQDEISLGQYMGFLMRQWEIMGQLLSVNPFDQPAVEKYKAETRKILARIQKERQRQRELRQSMELSSGGGTGIMVITPMDEIMAEYGSSLEDQKKGQPEDPLADPRVSPPSTFEGVNVTNKTVHARNLKSPIKFGTAGWRAGYLIPGQSKPPAENEDITFNEENVGRLAQAVANWLQETKKDSLSNTRLAVGFDARPNGREFAKLIVEVLGANGIKADLIDQITPTPVMAEATGKGGDYSLAIHVTASHNPVYRTLDPDIAWQGIKVLENGLPAGDATTSAIAAKANDAAINQVYRWTPYRDLPWSISRPGVNLIRQSSERLARVFEFDEAANVPVNRFVSLNHFFHMFRSGHNEFGLIVDTMHGSASMAAQIISDLTSEVKFLNQRPISEMVIDGTWQKTVDVKGRPVIKGPDPTNPAFSPEFASADKAGKLGIQIDGDGDRAVITDIDGKTIISPNDLGLLMLDYIYKTQLKGKIKKGHSLKVVRTLPTTRSLDRWVRKVNAELEVEGINPIELVETPVGSKNFAPYADDLLVAVEESGHIFFRYADQLFADSGVAEAVLMTEIVVKTGKSLSDYLKQVQEEIGGALLYNRTALDPKYVTPELKTALGDLRANRPDIFAMRLSEKLGKMLLRAKDGDKYVIKAGVSYDITDPTGILVRFMDDTWAMYRLSGTDGSVRIYGEETSAEDLRTQEQAVSDLLVKFSQPLKTVDNTKSGDVVVRTLIENALTLAGRDAADWADDVKRAEAIDVHNAHVGGVNQVIDGRKPADVSPKPRPIVEKASDSFRKSFAEKVKQGYFSWVLFAGGRATRMALPPLFDRLGIGGLTPAILKKLKELGYTDPAKIPNEEEFKNLINRAATGVVEGVDDLSFVQRDVLQLWSDIEKAAESAGQDSKEAVAGASFVVTVNPANKEAIASQMASLYFPGKIYLVEQPEEGGILNPTESEDRVWDESKVYPMGHGDPLAAMGHRAEHSYVISNGELKPLGRTLDSALEENGVDVFLFAQVNDLHLLNDVASINRWETALSEMEETGADFIIETVENVPLPPANKKQKGGGPLAKKAVSPQRIVLRDTLASKRPHLAPFQTPDSFSRMLYVGKRRALSKVDFNSMPVYLSQRPDRVTRETYSGDASSVLETNTMQQAGLPIFTFKDRSRIDTALETLEKQDKHKGWFVRLAHVTAHQAVFQGKSHGLPTGAADAVVEVRQTSDPKEELSRLKRFLVRLKRLAENQASSVPMVVVISDQHGTIDKFDALILDAIRRAVPGNNIPAGFQLNPDATLDSQLSPFGITLAGLKGKVVIHNLGDFMDRGPFGVKVYKRSVELITAGISDFVIGNHDLWMFLNLMGFHLPWYEGYRFYGYADRYDGGQDTVENLVARFRKDHSSENTPAWWAEKLADFNKFHETKQKNHWSKTIDVMVNGDVEADGKTRKKGTGLYAMVAKSIEGKPEQEKLWNQLRGFFLVDIQTGSRAVGHVSVKWWEDLLLDFERVNATLDGEETVTPDVRAAWKSAIGMISDQILPTLRADLEQHLAAGEWWWRVFEAINYQNYTSVEWWGKDWVFHEGWGTSVLKELNAGITDESKKVTPANYLNDGSQLNEVAAFFKSHFSLYTRDIYQNTYLHAILPVDLATGEFYFRYKDQEYRGKGTGSAKSVWEGLDAIAKDVREATDLSTIHEALSLVNSWYADNTTIAKPKNVLDALRHAGVDKIMKANGMNRLFFGHIPLVDFLKKESTHNGEIAGFNLEDRIFFTDHGMGDRFGGRGASVVMSPNGLVLSGYGRLNSKASESPSDNPNTVGTKEDAEKVLFQNQGIPGEKFLAELISNVEDRIAELEAELGGTSFVTLQSTAFAGLAAIGFALATADPKWGLMFFGSGIAVLILTSILGMVHIPASYPFAGGDEESLMAALDRLSKDRSEGENFEIIMSVVSSVGSLWSSEKSEKILLRALKESAVYLLVDHFDRSAVRMVVSAKKISPETLSKLREALKSYRTGNPLIIALTEGPSLDDRRISAAINNSVEVAIQLGADGEVEARLLVLVEALDVMDQPEIIESAVTRLLAVARRLSPRSRDAVIADLRGVAKKQSGRIQRIISERINEQEADAASSQSLAPIKSVPSVLILVGALIAAVGFSPSNAFASSVSLAVDQAFTVAPAGLGVVWMVIAAVVTAIVASGMRMAGNGRSRSQAFSDVRTAEKAGIIRSVLAEYNGPAEGRDARVEALLLAGPHGPIFGDLSANSVKAAISQGLNLERVTSQENRAEIISLVITYLEEVRVGRHLEAPVALQSITRTHQSANSLVTVFNVGQVKASLGEDFDLLEMVVHRVAEDNTDAHRRNRVHDLVIVRHSENLDEDQTDRLSAIAKRAGQNVIIVDVNEVPVVDGIRSYNDVLEKAKDRSLNTLKVVRDLLDENVTSTKFRTFDRVPGQFRADGLLRTIWTLLMNLGSDWVIMPVEDSFKAARVASTQA